MQWTFPHTGKVTNAECTIDIQPLRWSITVKITDKQYKPIDTHVFILEGLWLAVIKKTML
jgi:hypothetical protein